MKILLITSFFPPDKAIASVRPYMFAKYLHRMGHQVTVLCPQDKSCPQDNTWEPLDVKVCRYQGENIEQYQSAVAVQGQPQTAAPEKRRLAFLPDAIRAPLKRAYHKIRSPFIQLRSVKTAKNRVACQKAYINRMQDQQYDVVYATFGNLENIYAGQYAAKKFGCKWILDIRDPIAQYTNNGALRYRIWKYIQKKAVQSADICTAISAGVASQVEKGTGKKVIVLNNGYDAVDAEFCPPEADRVLRFAYTGTMYEERSIATPLFRAVKQLKDAGIINTDFVRVEYAGPHFGIIYDQARQYGVEDILVNHGSVSRSEAAAIQNKSDIFLVLTWNTKHEKGVLTGKFYEGIRAKRPILALVSGDEPNSEIFSINQELHYGFCYEKCSPDREFTSFCQWLEQAYSQKQRGKNVPYSPEEELFTRFRYDRLTEKLEKISLELMNKG